MVSKWYFFIIDILHVSNMIASLILIKLNLYSIWYQIGELKKGLNPLSFSSLTFDDKYLMISIKTGIIIGIISLAVSDRSSYLIFFFFYFALIPCKILQEGIAAGRSFAFFKNYNIDGNKEMIAFGLMNLAGSVTSCFLTTGE